MMASENSSQIAPDRSLRAFFSRFEEQAATADVEGLAAMYAPAFLMAGPSGTQVVKASDLMLAIPRRKQLFAAAGCRSTTLLSVDEIRLDDRYSLARTAWQWTFARADGTTEEITLPSAYLVERAPAGHRIVCYINHADIVAIMRERGLLPETAN
jgi:Domain of unknown function (DUF4440)